MNWGPLTDACMYVSDCRFGIICNTSIGILDYVFLVEIFIIIVIISIFVLHVRFLFNFRGVWFCAWSHLNRELGRIDDFWFDSFRSRQFPSSTNVDHTTFVHLNHFQPTYSRTVSEQGKLYT